MEIRKRTELMDKARGKRFRRRAGALFLAVALFAPVQEGNAAVESGYRMEQELHHIHIGTEAEGGGCYTEDILHVHEGDSGVGGACYGEPVYHEHTGNETEGGGCYGEKKYHVHEGNATEGGACYQDAAYHSHAGSASEGGGCYGAAVYHAHTGNASVGGGCYGTAVYHNHTGNVSGGGCYQKPIYHSHSGSSLSGGGCYTVPVCHAHAGDSVSGGACYQPVYHTHGAGCYTMRECRAVYSGDFQRISEHDEHCYHHDLTLHMTFEAVYNHQNCWQGMTRNVRTICWACQIMDMIHEYPELTCGKSEETIESYVLCCGKEEGAVEAWNPGCNQDENTVVGYEINCGKNAATVDSYRLDCGKNERSVDSYRLNCGKTEHTVETFRQDCGKTEKTVDSYLRNCEKDETVVDAYALSCRKTEESVDGYALGCGMEEDTVCAVFSLTNLTPEWSDGSVVLQAVCEDRENFLDGEQASFSWEDGYRGKTEWEDGNDSTGHMHQEREVTENGIYMVRLMAGKEDVAEQETVLSIEVKNIDRTAPAIREVTYDTGEAVSENEIRVVAEDIQPDGSNGSGLPQRAYSFDGGKTWEADCVYKLEENGVVDISVRDRCGNISERRVEIDNIRKEGDLGDTGSEDGKKDGDLGVTGDGKEDAPGLQDSGSDGNPDGDDAGSGEDGTGSGEDGTGSGGDGAGSGGEDDGSGEDGTGSGGEDDGSGGDGTGSGGEDDGFGGDDDNRGEDDGNSEERGEKKADNKNQEIGKKKEDHKKKDNSMESVREENRDVTEEREQQWDTKASGGKGSGAGEGNAEEDEGETGGEIKFPEHTRPEKKEEITVKQQEVKAAPVSDKPETMKKKSVAAPVVKAVTFTVSSVAFAATLLYLLYMMLRSIRVYHQDGEGKSHYAGSCMMKKTENGFEVRIPDMIVEQSATGQFTLRPGSLFASGHKGEELMILAGRRKEAVWIDREMPLRLTAFVS